MSTPSQYQIFIFLLSISLINFTVGWLSLYSKEVLIKVLPNTLKVSSVKLMKLFFFEGFIVTSHSTFINSLHILKRTDSEKVSFGTKTN